ncbi:extracellular solute-binding protein [Streptomyces ipomoeae]|uniref:ABC transporter, substrate-binding protein n=2 Tax=Streptomyces ipomoeae TaxID=103232 RepID=L1KS90_9ACTN|nr:extracellular solute-binding protein [Streptomyces ipomoeae]EKX63497.1 ABC transporter, substrate-binding protein [Streptomyces ipomoeae 91-03]MDX2697789.1 extracellular solute-binding protein [Streptomyces ipomoeae]MDX2825263.1 extracellular solute-binding protein [Streptomyces ipomoeae]MDX2843780.1 extracellular solute-binding protein [Streptomyces ipomoeae]MDX2877812.1 extracellular solute-binding protein [Streptomyces ipomoeae]
MARSSHFGIAVAVRPARRPLAAAIAATLALGTLAACGGGDDEPKVAENKISAGQVPDYYPADYSDIVEAAKKEGGKLTVYSNLGDENMAPIVRDFKKKYDFIKTVSVNELDSDELFQKTLSENAAGSSPADVLISSAATAWADFSGRKDTVLEYKSPELSELGESAELLPSVYSMSQDPMTIAYNTSLMEKPPTSLTDFAKIVTSDEDKYKNKVTVRDPEGSFGFTVTRALTEGNPEAWDDLKKILPLTRPETSSGTQLEKIVAGEYTAGFLISASPAYPVVEDSAGLVKIVFPKDGTVVLPRGIGISAEAPHPATSKLFLDFALSEEGQRAVAEGGLASYREGVKGEGLHTYQEVVDAVGEENIIHVKYEPVAKNDADAWLQRFDGLRK